MRDFKKYDIWILSHALTLRVYKETLQLPNSEKYGLISQIQRAAYSIPSNIVEGCGRDSEKEFNRFLQMSLGSANELEYFLILCADLGFMDKDISQSLQEEIKVIKRQIINLSKKLKATSQ